MDRDEQSKELKDFVESTDEHLNKLLTCFGWNENSIQDTRPPLICPFDASHHLCEKRLEQHLEKCQWKAEGYGDLDIPLSIPSVSPNAPSCITFDEQLQEDVIQLAKLKYQSIQMGTGGRLIPRTSDRLIADFTAEERQILYEYAVTNTVPPDIGEDIADLNKPQTSNENKTSSYLELLAQERNLKRRRTKHRGVHTNKKSQTEICREVINQQMEILAEYIADKNDYGTEETVNCSSRTFSELQMKDNSKYDRRNSLERNNYDFDENNRSRCRSTNEFHCENNMKDMRRNHHDEIKYSKYRRKSSKERDEYRDRDYEDRKHKKSHKKHHSKHHHHRDKNKRHCSNERATLSSSSSSSHSKKSKYHDKKK